MAAAFINSKASKTPKVELISSIVEFFPREFWKKKLVGCGNIIFRIFVSLTNKIELYFYFLRKLLYCAFMFSETLLSFVVLFLFLFRFTEEQSQIRLLGLATSYPKRKATQYGIVLCKKQFPVAFFEYLLLRRNVISWLYTHLEMRDCVGFVL